MPKPRVHIASIFFSILFGVAFLINIILLLVVNISNAKLLERPENLPASFCETLDEQAPEITLNGALYSTLIIGTDSYEELGASAIDDCDEVNVTINGVVNSDVAGQYSIHYSAEDKSGNIATVIRTVNVVPQNRGTVYLTFDDGPGPYTAQLLDVLKKYNIKATFFVTGRGDDALILREYQDGHTIGLHTYTHDYSYIYQNIDTFFDDLYRVQKRVENITGYTSYLMRFPGGSSNTVSKRYDGGTKIMSQLVSEVERRGFTYFDWNVSSGDASTPISADEVFENVVYALKDGGNSVVLQHDIKDYSVAAVEHIIQFCLANGYKLEPLTASSFAAHHGINN